MATLEEWFERYGASHRHPVNRALHMVCVPLIAATLLVLLAAVPVPGPFKINLGELALLGAIAGYSRLSVRHAIGVAVIAALLTGLWLHWATPLRVGPLLVVFVLAWAGQFIGHLIEGQRPSFLDDLRFLFIGPLWVLEGVYRRLGLSSASGH